MPTGHPVLVSSGIGSRFGGIGAVAAMLARAMGPELVLWRHFHRWPRPFRRAALAARAVAGGVLSPQYVMYEHVDLSVLHARIPGLAGIPYAVFLHGTEVWKALDAGRTRALLGASLLLGNSRFTVEHARAVNPSLPEVKVVHLGVPARLDRAAAIASRPNRVLLLGRMSSAERYKGHDEVLECWAAVREQVPGAVLVIAGDGDDAPRIRERARGLPGVEFVGFVDDAERERLYGESRLVMALSSGEGFGLVALEASVRGAAVVGLAGTVIDEIFPPGVGPVRLASREPGAVAGMVTALLRDPERAQRCADSARALVEAHFLEEHAVGRFRAALSPWIA